MKLNRLFSILAAMLLAVSLSSCDGEQDLIIIEGELPIKANAVYMVGDATPAGWDIGNPTPLTKQSQYIFVYEGPLNVGEMKACTQAGDWGVPFLRPTFGGCKISSGGVENAAIVYANDPDDKWSITEAGQYRLTFDLQNYTLKAEKL